CEPVREPLDQPLQGGFPLLAVELDCIFEWLEMQIVAIASHVEPEAQHDRDFQCLRKLPRRGGEWRRGAEEIDVDHVVARTRAVHEQRYEGALVERLLDRERRRRAFLAGIDDGGRELRIERVEHARKRGILLEVEHDSQRDVLSQARHRAKRIETADVGPENENAASPSPPLAQTADADKAHVEARVLGGYKDHAIQNHRRERIGMFRDLPEARSTPEHATQIRSRGAALRSSAYEEIERDRVEHDAARPAAEEQRKRANELEAEHRPALGTLDPLLFHSPDSAFCAGPSLNTPCARRTSSRTISNLSSSPRRERKAF